MFAGGRRRTSNIRVMQLFHELKQQFPTVPDHIVTACIANYANRNTPEGNPDIRNNFAFREVLEAAAALRSVEDQELMGRTLTKPADPTVSLSEPSLNQIPNVTELSKIEPRDSSHPLTTNSETRHTTRVDETPVVIERKRSEMNESDSDVNRNVVKPSAFYSKESESVSVNPPERKLPLRPNHLDIKCETPAFERSAADTDSSGFNRIQPSERCFDLQKLLNTENLNVKPPRSPLSAKRFANASLKNSPTKSDQNINIRSPLASPDISRKTPLHYGSTDSVSASTSGVGGSISGSSSNNNNLSSASLPNLPAASGGSRRSDPPDRRPDTAEIPTQTIETLIGSGSVNLSLNVNCQMDLVQSPTLPRHSSVLQVTPQLPWCQEPMSQRSYTSVNLTLRPPSSEPQPPIDITSQNSSLTYSTSSFDSQKGLQSRLQITVGPGGGSVSSVRTRPRSSYHPQVGSEETVPVRAGSLPDLATECKSPVISKQQARIEKLRIELITEKGRLIAMQEEVASLEKPSSITCKADVEMEKQLQKEIRQLRGQCERLTYDVDRQSESRVPLGETNEEFYRNIYTGQRGPFTLGSSERVSNQSRHMHYHGPTSLPQVEIEGPKWNCHMCTFQNHPLLDKCEQCEMPRILHVSAAPGDNIHIHVTPRISSRPAKSKIVNNFLNNLHAMNEKGVIHSWVL